MSIPGSSCLRSDASAGSFPAVDPPKAGGSGSRRLRPETSVFGFVLPRRRLRDHLHDGLGSVQFPRGSRWAAFHLCRCHLVARHSSGGDLCAAAARDGRGARRRTLAATPDPRDGCDCERRRWGARAGPKVLARERGRCPKKSFRAFSIQTVTEVRGRSKEARPRCVPGRAGDARSEQHAS